MATVTSRIQQIKQPFGGYVNPSKFDVLSIDEGEFKLNPCENIPATLIGLAVDYFTRLFDNPKPQTAFEIPLIGADIAEKQGKISSKVVALKLIRSIMSGYDDLDEQSIISMCKLVTFDSWYRNPVAAKTASDYSTINPDEKTIENIETMVMRSVTFFRVFGPIKEYGFTFSPNSFTSKVQAGDGDFLTEDTLWDLKVLKSSPTSKHTLQLLMYWIMGQHSDKSIFKNITKLGIFNPRLNKAYILKMSDVSEETIKTVETEVIGY